MTGTCICVCGCSGSTPRPWPHRLCDECFHANDKKAHHIHVDPCRALPDDVPKVVMWGTDPYHVSIAELERAEKDRPWPC